ncbi:MAG: DUF5320 domain-containing protein [Candidatus Humimicrobiaceae bacterium]
MCDTKKFNRPPSTGCCCGDNAGHHVPHQHSFKPAFPSKEEQLKQLKNYKQMLEGEIAETEKRIKELG